MDDQTGGAPEKIEVFEEPDKSRYVVTVDGARAGLAAYRVIDGVVVFTHTEIDDAFGGRGLAKKLAVTSLDEQRERGNKVVPLCPFYGGFIDKNPDYADLVDEALYARLRR